MAKQILKSKIWIIAILVFAFLLSSSNAFAWGHGGRYYWHGGGWHRDGWFWGGVAVSALTVGAVVASLPPHYKVVYTGNAPYYYDGTYYYQSYPNGYVIMAPPVIQPAPVVVVQPQTATVPVAQLQAHNPNTVVVNVPNQNGTYTAVTLTKHKTGYLGPQGEYYEGHPTVKQLRVLYGK